MSLTLEDILADVRASHESLYRHLKGVTDVQLYWKPYPECKSIHETLAHLIAVEWSAQSMLDTGTFPDYETHQRDAIEYAVGVSLDQLVEKLKDEQVKTIEVVWTKFRGVSLDTEIQWWGYPSKLGIAASRLGNEATYHSGQIAFIRLATDPEWDYYKEIYWSEG
jgi:hypothetical protein